MKKMLFFLLLTGTFGGASPGPVQAQTTTAGSPGAHDPTFLNQVYYWAPDSLMILEKTSGEMKMTRGTPFGGGGGGAYVLEGPRSAVRIKSGDNIRFAIKLTGMADPTMMLKLYQLDPRKKTREATTSQGGMFSKAKNNAIDCNVQKSGTDVYILIPSTHLAPGEYGFMNMMQPNSSGTRVSYTFFAFGVDP